MRTYTKEEILQNFENRKNRDLLLSIAIDLVGCATYILPGLGEGFDLVAAPLSGLAIYLVHKTKVGASLGFLEEIIPFTDIVPTATLIWVKRYKISRETTLKEFMQELHQDHSIVDDFLAGKKDKPTTISID